MDEKRTFAEIAEEIKKLWPVPYFGAEPYIEAMLTLNTSEPSELYGLDEAGTIVRYFLANATTWRGVDARRIKSELKLMLA